MMLRTEVRNLNNLLRYRNIFRIIIIIYWIKKHNKGYM